MAKRKSVRKPRKKVQKTSSFLSTVKRMFIGAFIVVACFIGFLFIYDFFAPMAGHEPVALEKKGQETVSSKKAVTAPKQKVQDKTSAKKAPAKPSTKTFKIPANTEIPRLKEKRQEQVIKHEGYTVSYNSEYRIANWVAYELTATEAKSKKTERSNKFVSDPQVKGATAMNEDYTRSGYDRGHLAPAGDMKWSAKAMRESFYLSNICPQKPKLNRGIWKDLEEQCRLWALDNGSLLIVTGPVITGDMKRLGKNKVAIPKSFYKVLCYYTEKGYKGIGFLFENRDYKDNSLKSMVIPIDSVEKVTGIDFFPSIPDEQEKEMEATVDWSSWSF
ncbi:DNA/RNA non-specific endonuclease [Parabacteroides johnsonii]|uniref:Endonuclease n=2 Tax=Parabacteroides johnsonii TaxID=387661 RepID=A0AAW6HZM5_9BACT|nr:DNA/RNA non-specific endonuclease [Parabacteroides johnsonii]MBS6223718.1 DNA/RNA non-specific endonuclease [Parabacteroides johnsonii]MDC7148743.1 DNA/RNA non-specific endonuclease [Parabacteroides johnsonii]MDC7156801.1 DNA/RNA non-specific endonuclease [Parabacteroides johnsonii]